MKIITATL